MNRTLLILLLTLALAGAAWAIATEPPLEDPEQAQLYERLIHEVRCLVCQNQTVGDSTAPLAADLRREIHRLVEEGKTEAQVKDFLLQRYGDFVLYRPQFRGTTALLWLAPALLLALGGITLAMIVRRRKALPNDIDADESPGTELKP